MKVDPNDIRTPDVEELGQTSRLYTLHCGIELNEEPTDTAAAAGQQMSHSDRQNHHLWLKSKANRSLSVSSVYGVLSALKSV